MCRLTIERLAKDKMWHDDNAEVHLDRVVSLLKEWKCTDPVTLGTAWGHELLEKCKNVSKAEIESAGGAEGALIYTCIQRLTFMTKRQLDNLNRQSLSPEVLTKKHAEYVKRLQDVSSPAGTVPLLVKLADCIATAEARVRELTDMGGLLDVIRDIRKDADLFKGLKTLLGDKSKCVEKSRRFVRAIAGDRPAIEEMSKDQFVEFLEEEGADHSDGYYQYTQWDSFRKMLAGPAHGFCGGHRVMLLSRMEMTNDGIESFWGQNYFVSCFTYSKYEDIAMWLNYGRRKGFSSGAVRLHFDRDAMKDWYARYRRARSFSGIYGVMLDEEGNVCSSKDISASVEGVWLADVGYLIPSAYQNEHHAGNVEHRRKFFCVKDGTGSGFAWSDAICQRQQEEGLLPIFKKRGWAYEREVRLVVKLKDEAAASYGRIAIAFDGPFKKLEEDIIAARAGRAKDRVWRFPVLQGPWFNEKTAAEPVRITTDKGDRDFRLKNALRSEYQGEVKVETGADGKVGQEDK